MKRITVITRDALLGRRIALLFGGEYSVTVCESAAADGGIRIADIDTLPEARGDILLSQGGGDGVITLPFLIEELVAAVSTAERAHADTVSLVEGERAVRLRGEIIRLTEVEHRLLSVLMSAPVGEYVSRERLINEVWGGECDGGVVNVYIHYLREKMEKNGEKIIICSRREGYKLDERIGR